MMNRTLIFLLVLHISVISSQKYHHCPLQNNSYTELQWDWEPASLSLECVGRTNELHCCAQHFTEIHWFERPANQSDFQPLSTSEYRYVDDNERNETVVFTRLRYSDAHEYKCVVRDGVNDRQLTQRVSMIVLNCSDDVQPPIIVQPPRSVTHVPVVLGRQVALKCQAYTGYHPDIPPQIYWRRCPDGKRFDYECQDGRHMININGKYSQRIYAEQTARIQERGVESVLHIESVGEADLGWYCCEPYNNYEPDPRAWFHIEPAPVPRPLWQRVLLVALPLLLVVSLIAGLFYWKHLDMRVFVKRMRAKNRQPTDSAYKHDVVVVSPDLDECQDCRDSLLARHLAAHLRSQGRSVFSAGDIVYGDPNDVLLSACAHSASVVVILSRDVLHHAFTAAAGEGATAGSQSASQTTGETSDQTSRQSAGNTGCPVSGERTGSGSQDCSRRPGQRGHGGLDSERPLLLSSHGSGGTPRASANEEAFDEEEGQGDVFLTSPTEGQGHDVLVEVMETQCHEVRTPQMKGEGEEVVTPQMKGEGEEVVAPHPHNGLTHVVAPTPGGLTPSVVTSSVEHSTEHGEAGVGGEQLVDSGFHSQSDGAREDCGLLSDSLDPAAVTSPWRRYVCTVYSVCSQFKPRCVLVWREREMRKADWQRLRGCQERLQVELSSCEALVWPALKEGEWERLGAAASWRHREVHSTPGRHIEEGVTSTSPGRHIEEGVTSTTPEGHREGVSTTPERNRVEVTAITPGHTEGDFATSGRHSGEGVEAVGEGGERIEPTATPRRHSGGGVEDDDDGEGLCDEPARKTKVVTSSKVEQFHKRLYLKLPVPIPTSA